MEEKKAVREAFNELAPRYEKTIDNELKVFWGWNYKAFATQLVDLAEISENQYVLDLATGTAVIPRLISEKGISGIHITGLDITESMLNHGKKELSDTLFPDVISLTCADAMKLPFPEDTFDVIITGLSTHHMNISNMFLEIKRTLKEKGKFFMIDVGVSPIWHFPLVRGVSRLLAFTYFLINENITRAYAEAASVTNVKTADEWYETLSNLGFIDIMIEELPVPRKWLPTPLSISAIRS